MKPHLAYYVHHHGRGHVSRARAIVSELRSPVTVLTSSRVERRWFPDADVVRLDPDTDPPETDHQPQPPAHLHYAPLGVPGLRERSAQLARFVADAAPSLFVVDVSVEVAQAVRLTGTPVVYVRQHGDRWDPPHLAAYDGACGLLAPFGAELEEPDVPQTVRAKTFYAGGFARVPHPLPDRTRARHQLGWPQDDAVVVVLCGSGGDGPASEAIVAAASSTSNYRWVVVGRSDVRGAGVASVGWVDDPLPYVAAADLVVGSAGHNTLMEVATVGRPFVCVPEDRPFQEQRRKAERLRALDAAEVVDDWPGSARWPEVLQRASARGEATFRTLVDPDGARRAAAWLESLVVRFAS